MESHEISKAHKSTNLVFCFLKLRVQYTASFALGKLFAFQNRSCQRTISRQMEPIVYIFFLERDLIGKNLLRSVKGKKKLWLRELLLRNAPRRKNILSVESLGLIIVVKRNYSHIALCHHLKQFPRPSQASGARGLPGSAKYWRVCVYVRKNICQWSTSTMCNINKFSYFSQKESKTP